jgi:2'-5' RNA ligase
MDPCHRLFFALKPPVPEARRIGQVRDCLGLAERGVADDRLHMTMGITGDHARMADAIVTKLPAIGDTVSGEASAVTLDRLSGSMRSVALRPSRRPPALASVQGQNQRLLDYWGLAREGWSFSPHVTLLYRTGQPFQTPIPPRGWQADELFLVHSVVGETRHILIDRWKIAPRQARLL